MFMEKKKGTAKKKGNKIMYVTAKEHAKWHKENSSCGTGKEHDACMKRNKIVIRG